MPHCQSPWLLDLLVPVRSLEIRSHLIVPLRARMAFLRKWTVRGTILYANFMQALWQSWLWCSFPGDTFIYLMLITLVGPVAEPVCCQGLLLLTRPGSLPGLPFSHHLWGMGFIGSWSPQGDATFLQRPWARQFNLNEATGVMLPFSHWHKDHLRNPFNSVIPQL